MFDYYSIFRKEKCSLIIFVQRNKKCLTLFCHAHIIRFVQCTNCDESGREIRSYQVFCCAISRK